jgi:hypothetical protein
MLDSLDTLIGFALIMLVVSLLITIVVQVASALFNLRGLNLLSGLTSAFTVILPGMGKNNKELADYLLKGGLLSDSFLPNSFLQKWQQWPLFRNFLNWLNHWRHTSAIRPGELFDAIHRIAIGKEPADDKLKNNARQLLIALGGNPKAVVRALDRANKEITGAQDEVKALNTRVQHILKSLPETVRIQLQDQVDAAVKTVGEKLTAAGESAAGKVVTAAGNIDAAYRSFNYWVCICQERADQWLTMHTRLLTVFFAIIAAFALQLDTVEIFKLVSSNKALREKLLAQAAAVSSQAEKTLGDSPSLLQSAYDKWLSGVDDANVKSTLTSSSPVKITPADTRETVVHQIENALAKIDENARIAALDSFGKTVDETITGDLKDKAHDYAKIQDNFEKNTGFQLLPDNDRGRWNTGRWSYKGHLVGILFSIALLSLGAPFWYNTLKNLVDLRSQVAQNISDEQKQREAGKSAPAAEPPPTISTRSST